MGDRLGYVDGNGEEGETPGSSEGVKGVLVGEAEGIREAAISTGANVPLVGDNDCTSG